MESICLTSLTRLYRLLLLLVLLLSPPAQSVLAGVRIKDVAKIEGLRTTKVIGYGLVVGLDGTGDGRRSLFTIQSVTNMLKRFGLTVPPELIKVDNVAAVMVTADLPPFARAGTEADVVVSSMGDAESLEGGTLLLTPLVGTDGIVYAMAQGPLSIGGFNVTTAGGERVRKNYTLVGRVPRGAVLERDLSANVGTEGQVALALKEPDFTSAKNLAEAINARFQATIATPVDAGQVAIHIPTEYQGEGKTVEFISLVENLETEIDGIAKVVVNERTGTVVIGEKVVVSPAAVSHGNLSVEISAVPVIAQPLPFSQGQTVVTQQTETRVTTEEMHLVPITGGANVKDIADALNALGITPRDLIAILQALKAAGALRAELVIL